MDPAVGLGLVLIAVGLVVLFLGKRLVVLGAGVGALLGVGLLQLIPGSSIGIFAFVLPIGLAIVGGMLAFFMKAAANMFFLVIGFIAGGAVVLALFDMLAVDLGLMAFVIASLGGLVGIYLVRRFANWATIVIVGLVAGFLIVNGIELLLPTVQFSRSVKLLLTGAIAAADIWYLGFRGK